MDCVFFREICSVIWVTTKLPISGVMTGNGGTFAVILFGSTGIVVHHKYPASGVKSSLCSASDGGDPSHHTLSRISGISLAALTQVLYIWCIFADGSGRSPLPPAKMSTFYWV